MSSAERLSLRLRPVVRPIRQAHGPEALEGQAHHPEEDRGEGSPSTPLGTGKRGKLSSESFPRASNGGAEGIRTLDLVTASHARSQLRHSPEKGRRAEAPSSRDSSYCPPPWDVKEKYV